MNTPNKLTLLRIILVPFIIAATMIYFPFHYLTAGLIFGAASLTDYFDGKIARRDNLITDFGKFADPLADKILVISIMVCFVSLQLSMAAPVIIILFREFAVTSIRLVASSKGKVIAANMWGKVKTVSQIIAISVIYFILALRDVLVMFTPLDMSFAETLIPVISNILIWITAVFTIVSGVKYIYDNREIINEK